MSSQRTLDDWLSYIGTVPPEAVKRGLTRVAAVAKKLNLLHWDAQIIIVSGTNGKGSTVSALEAIYTEANYNVASFTSPHLIKYNERIRVQQQPISDEQLCQAFQAVDKVRNGIPLIFFEIWTLAALWHFRKFKLDVIILEVGIGGRLDPTNIVDANLAIITTVDLDHQQYLGDTKEAIGYEKSGILRASRPFIYADHHPPASVVDEARKLNVPLYCLGEHYLFKTTDTELEITLSDDELVKLPRPNINPKTAAAAYMATKCLQNTLPVTLSQLSDTMRNVAILGRLQIVDGKIKTLFDVAHNPQAVQLLADFIHRYQPIGKVHAVFSGLKDKDLCGLIKPMQSCVDFWYPALLSGTRAASASLLKEAFHAANCPIPTVCYDIPLDAYDSAMRAAKPDDLIVVYGSFLTVSAIMAANRTEQEGLQ